MTAAQTTSAPKVASRREGSTLHDRYGELEDIERTLQRSWRSTPTRSGAPPATSASSPTDASRPAPTPTAGRPAPASLTTVGTHEMYLQHSHRSLERLMREKHDLELKCVQINDTVEKLSEELETWKQYAAQLEQREPQQPQPQAEEADTTLADVNDACERAGRVISEMYESVPTQPPEIICFLTDRLSDLVAAERQIEELEANQKSASVAYSALADKWERKERECASVVQQLQEENAKLKVSQLENSTTRSPKKTLSQELGMGEIISALQASSQELRDVAAAAASSSADPSASGKHKQMEDVLREIVSASQLSREQAASLQATVAQLQDELSDLRVRNAQLEGDNDTLRLEVASSSAHLDGINNELDTLKALHQQQQQELQALRTSSAAESAAAESAAAAVVEEYQTTCEALLRENIELLKKATRYAQQAQN